MSARRASSGNATEHGDEHGGPNAAERCESALLDDVPPGEDPTDRAVGISREKQQDMRDFAEWALRLRCRTIAQTEPDARGNMKSVRRKLKKGPSEGTTPIQKRQSASLSALALDPVGDGSHAFPSNRLLMLYGCGPDSRRQEKQKNQKNGLSVDDWGSSSPAELPYGMYFPNELWVVRYVTRLARAVLDELQEDDLLGGSAPGESAQKYVAAQEDAMLVPVPSWMLQVCRCAGGRGVHVFWVPDEECPTCFDCVKPVRSAPR